VSTKLDDAFATLRNLITDQTRDLAMAMAELRSVAAERDKLRNPAGATIADGGEWTREEAIEMHRRKADELLTVKTERDKLKSERGNLSEALERNCVQYVQKQRALIAERDKARADLSVAKEKMDAQACVTDGFRIQRDKIKIERDSANWSLSRAKESLRAAEQDVAELEADNSTLRTVNLRILADYNAATQRAETAEAILRAKA
jgi:hypothetical protein